VPVPPISRAALGGRVAPAATALVALGCCGVAAVMDPTRPGSVGPPCPFKMLTGWACPVCGSTRMLHELTHGHLGAAARDNAVVLGLLPVMVYAWLTWATSRPGRRGLPTWRPPTPVLRAGLGLWLAFAVARNLPWAPVQGLRV